MKRSISGWNRSPKNRSIRSSVASRPGASDQPLPVDAAIRPSERDPRLGHRPQVRVVAALVARERRVAVEPRPRARQLLERRQRHADVRPAERERAEPAEDVAAAIPPRDPAGRPDRQVHLAARVLELLGDLDAGLAGADDEDRARRQIRLAPVGVRVERRDPRRQRRSDLRDARDVERAARDDDVLRRQRPVVRVEREARRRIAARGAGRASP